MSDAAQALGLKLKAERERRGVSAQKMANDMHLDGWVIEALEAGDYQRIGPAVYAKGHLKKYAALLGVSAVDGPAPAEAKPSPNVPVPIIRLEPPEAARLPRPALVAALAALLLVGAVLWLRPWHAAPSKPPATLARSRSPAASGAQETAASSPTASSPTASSPTASGAEQAAAVAASAADSEEPLPAPMSSEQGLPPGRAVPVASNLSTGVASAPPAVSDSAARLAPAAARSQASAASAELTPGVGRARLRLSFSADSRVDVYDYSGKAIFTGNGRANSVKTIAGIAPFRVYLGFASGVQLQVNDRTVAIGPQFVTGEVARFEAGADGVLRRDSRATSTSGATAAASPRG